MSQLSAQSIRNLCLSMRPLITPFSDEKVVVSGTSYGLSACSYDVRIGHGLILNPGAHSLAHTLEDFDLPHNVVGYVVDKSTYARRFMSAMNTLIDPGFIGNLTLELVNHSDKVIVISEGDPICQIVFHWLDQATDRPYTGKYQNQTKAAHGPRYE